MTHRIAPACPTTRRSFVTGAAALAGTCALGAASAAYADESADATATPGFYGGVGTGQGKGGDLTVEVSLEDGKLVRIHELRSHETLSVGTAAQDIIRELVLRDQTLNVDSVSGATITSFAYKAAIAAALEDAGEDTSEWEKRPKAERTREAAIPEQADVVVVGSGGAGLAAAISAAQGGASVVLLEKLDIFGGSTALSGFGYAAPGSWAQQRKGIEDSADALAEDMLVGGDNLGDPELVHTLCDGALDSFNWLTFNVGMPWYSFVVQDGGHSCARSTCPVDYGAGAVVHLTKKARTAGVQMFNDARVSQILTDEAGAVTGVKVEDKLTGEEVTVATPAVVLATGGFGANVQMRSQWDPELDERYRCTDSRGADGDGIALATELGANLVGMEWIQTHPYGSTTDGTMLDCGGVRTSGTAALVNTAGQRFVEELERRDVVSKGILAQEGGVGYMVMTEADAAAEGYTPETYDETATMYANGTWVIGETLEEVCEPFGIDPEGLAQTLATWNADVEKNSDSQFGYRAQMFPIGEGPYVAFPVTPTVHYTMGGVQIDRDAHVINEDGEVIPGLFAAGEVTGGIMGTNRLGTTAVADITVFGRIAGEGAARLATA